MFWFGVQGPRATLDGDECIQTTRRWRWRKTLMEVWQWRPGSPASDHLLEHLLLVREASRPFPKMWLA